MQTIDLINLFLINGNIARVAVNRRQSLTVTERRIILRNREEGYKANWTWPDIRKIENDGFFGSTPFGKTVDAVFAYEDVGALGIKKRMYNVRGVDNNRESTMDCADLIARRIVPNDMLFIEVLYQALKVAVSNNAARLEVTYYNIREKLKRK